MITLKNTLLLICCLLGAVACGGSKQNKQVEHSTNLTIDLSEPDQSKTLVQDFPITLYVEYPTGVDSLEGITSINMYGPLLHVHQSNGVIGYIDTASDSLSYKRQDYSDLALQEATDLEVQEQAYWFVSGANTVSQTGLPNGEVSTWQLKTHYKLTELAVNDQEPSKLWLFNRADHQLIHFDTATEAELVYDLKGEYEPQGLAWSGEKLLVLAGNNSDYIVAEYDTAGTSLKLTASWKLSGFNGEEFNDVSLAPDGRIIVSSNAVANNIFLVADKSELIGTGLIEHDTELQLVKQVELEQGIAQPSGIWPVKNGGWLLITDQAEVFLLDSSFKIIEKVSLQFSSIECNQGCTEAVVGTSDSFHAITDTGVIGLFVKVGSEYQLKEEVVVAATNEQGDAYEYAGLGHNEATGEFYLVTDQDGAEEEDKLIILDSTYKVINIYPITYGSESNGSIFEYDAQGVVYKDGAIYVLSQRFTKLLKLTMTGEIVSVTDLSETDVKEPSDFAIREGKIYIIGDHENNETVPPISIFEIVQS